MTRSLILLAALAVSQASAQQIEPPEGEYSRIEKLERVAPKARTLEQRLALGRLYRKVGRPDAALDEASALVREHPTSVDAKFLLAEVKLDAGQAREALVLFDEVAQSRPGSAQVQLRRSQALSALGKNREADAASALYHSRSGANRAATR